MSRIVIAGAAAVVLGGVCYKVYRWRVGRSVHDSLITIVDPDTVLDGVTESVHLICGPGRIDPKDLNVLADRTDTEVRVTLRFGGMVMTIGYPKSDWIDKRSYLITEMTKRFYKELSDVAVKLPVVVDSRIRRDIRLHITFLLMLS